MTSATHARTNSWRSLGCSGAGGGEVNFQGRYYRIEGARLNTPFIAPDRTSPGDLRRGARTFRPAGRPARRLSLAVS